jgi:putative SOS response-associated peptidase YedK
MCASFLIRKEASKDIPAYVEARRDIEFPAEELIVPHRLSPIVVKEEKNIAMLQAGFSLIPDWLKDPKPKFATHNARIETLSEKPTWRKALEKRHCLIPISEFIEPIYEGEWAGKMVSFSVKETETMWAAGLWEARAGIPSFAIITSEPSDFISRMGHDRSPVFLDPDVGEEWVQNQNFNSPQVAVEFLKANQIHRGEMNIKKFRALKSGWEKRKT